MFDLYYVYVLFLFVLLFVSLSQFAHTLFPSFWYSGAYALVLAYATRARGPLAGVWGSPPLSSRMYLCTMYALLQHSYVTMFICMY